LSAHDIDRFQHGSGKLNGVPGYLVIVDAEASSGRAPTFQFAADAFIENDNGYTISLPQEFSIPTYGLNDAIDLPNDQVRPGNQVIESGPSFVDGPDASPIFTAIRTSTTAIPGFDANVRVVDVPMFNSGNHSNVIVVWSDRNNAESLWNNPSLSCAPTWYAIDDDEQSTSFTGTCLPNELNFVVVPDRNDYFTATGGLLGNLGINDNYANLVNTGNASARTLTDGFLKLVLPTETGAVPAGAAPGSYSSVIMFNIPVGAYDPAAQNPTPDTDTPVEAVDTGFFSTPLR
jgi:hypothetical protein